MNQLLYTVEEVFGSYLNTQTHYFIPLYQRGYKWESKHIIKLLEDIHTFKQESNKFYCLQNITIVAKDNCFNVIDGQQRLTTLTVLLSILDKKNLVKNKIQFPNNSIRKETNIFINNDIMATSPSFLTESWEDFISKQPTFDHQDIYHLFVAYKTIIDWFSKKEAPSKEDFCDKLLKNVKLIVNKISENNSEEKIFGNLNSKRIPLDGADLVRAILITRVAQEEGKREADIKNIVRVNERRVKIGWELDQINNWWSRKEVKGYFSKFIQAKSEEVGKNKLFREDKYPFNLLLLLFAEKKGKTKLTLQLIEEHNTSALALYKELIKLDNTLQDWFNDREIYHYLGFLFNHVPKKELNFSNIWEKWQDFFWKNRDKTDKEATADKGFNEFLRWIQIIKMVETQTVETDDSHADTAKNNEIVKFIRWEATGVRKINSNYLSLKDIDLYFQAVKYLYTDFKNHLIKVQKLYPDYADFNLLNTDWLCPKEDSIGQIDCFSFLPILFYCKKYAPYAEVDGQNLFRIVRFFHNLKN